MPTLPIVVASASLLHKAATMRKKAAKEGESGRLLQAGEELADSLIMVRLMR